MNLKPAVFFIRPRCILRHRRFLVFLSSLLADLRTIVKFKAYYVVNFNQDGPYGFDFWRFDVSTPAAIPRGVFAVLRFALLSFLVWKRSSRSFARGCGCVLIRRRGFNASDEFVCLYYLDHLMDFYIVHT